MYNPMMSYYLAAQKQRDLLREAEQDRQARAAAPDRVAADRTDLVERVLASVWKRLGLPAQEVRSRATHGMEQPPFSKEAPGSSY
jgi:hypothetical protein